MTLLLPLGGCGSGDAAKARGSYDCGGPLDTPVAGRDGNLEVMKTYGLARDAFPGARRGLTEPRGLSWDAGTSAGGQALLAIDGTDYVLEPNDRDSWDVRAGEALVGTFILFSHRVATAIDADHCGTHGMKFEVDHAGQRETGRFQIGIE